MRRRDFLISLASLPLLPGLGLAAAPPPPDVLFVNGKIATFDPVGTVAQAAAVKDGVFTAIGRAKDLKKLAGADTRLVDLGGRTVIPGLIDAHCHPMETMYLRDDWVDCRYPAVPSVAKALDNIAAWAKKTPKGQWIFAACVSASENKFAEKRLPTKAELDKAAPDNPLILANGAHMAVVNSQALAVLGVTKGVRRLPRGGTVILDPDGQPTGVLADAQADVPDNPTLAELESYYVKGIQDFWNARGFTSLLAITPAGALPVLRRVAASGARPNIRYTVSVWTAADDANMPEDFGAFAMPGTADPDYYRFFGVKDWIDGENDARTGYMCDPYVGHDPSDPPGDRGTLVTDQAGADRLAALAVKNGAACMFHCSGDAATDIGLSAYEKALAGGGTGTIKRIEHFGMFQLSEAQLKRAAAMKRKGLFISTQPAWLADLVKADYENMGPARATTGFRFRSMIDAGLEPAASTDMTGIYLGNIDPFLAVHAVVTRDSDRGRFLPAEAITVDEALRMWTIWAARSMGEADRKGSIEAGKLADMTVLSDDVFSMPKEKLKTVKAVMTIVGGRTVHQAA